MSESHRRGEGSGTEIGFSGGGGGVKGGKVMSYRRKGLAYGEMISYEVWKEGVLSGVTQ